MASISLIHKLSLLHYLPMSSHSSLQQVCYIRSLRSHEVYRVMVVDVGWGGGGQVTGPGGSGSSIHRNTWHIFLEEWGRKCRFSSLMFRRFP